jgi:hypothetical protein
MNKICDIHWTIGERILINNLPYKVKGTYKFLFWWWIVFEKDFFREGEF